MKFERYDQTTIPYEVKRLFDLQYDSTYFSESSYISETVSQSGFPNITNTGDLSTREIPL